MKKLYRQKDSLFFGVCSGLGKYFDMDANIVRLIFFLLLFTPFPILITYVFMLILIPIEQEDPIDNEPQETQPKSLLNESEEQNQW